MNQFKIILLLTLSLLFSCATKTPQSTASQVKAIDDFVATFNAKSSLKETVTEGVLTDTKGFEDIGTFKYYRLYDENSNALYRIKNVETTDKTITETYYFQNNNLVKITYADPSGHKAIYLNKNKVISASDLSVEMQRLLIEKAKRFKKSS